MFVFYVFALFIHIAEDKIEITRDINSRRDQHQLIIQLIQACHANYAIPTLKTTSNCIECGGSDYTGDMIECGNGHWIHFIIITVRNVMWIKIMR